MNENQKKWTRVLYIIGVFALIAGALDPMEGSVVIAFGSLLIAISAYVSKDRHRKIFIACTLAIISGVFFLFFFSALGGIGKGSDYSMWWGLTMLTYPLGWLTEIILLIARAISKKKMEVKA